MNPARLRLTFLLTIVFAFSVNVFPMDRVVLKGNDSSGVNAILTQDMLYKLENGIKVPSTNTIFVIQDDFVLAEDITIPNDCILEFEGGSLRNGRINTNGCYIDAPLYQVFDNIVFNTLNTPSSTIEIVDNICVRVLKGDSYVNKKTNTLIPRNSVVNRRYVYRITGKGTSTAIDGNKVTITLNGQKYTVAEKTADNQYKLKYDYTSVIGITNATGQMASGVVNSLKGITFYSIAELSYSNISQVRNKEVHPEWFGAKGDNKNDDSYAFNTALDLAYYSDSKVVIGNGVYRIDDALVVHTHTNLSGVVPTVEHPVRGCFSVNTDVAMLVFDRRNPSGSYVLEYFGFIPFSDKYKSNYTGIKVYHSQNHARISGIGFYYPKTGIEVDAIGGVQLLRCEDISQWGEENKGIVALLTRYRLGGWYNANYFRPAFIAYSTVVKSEGGRDNTLDGGSTETNSYTDYLVDLDESATLIVRGGLYKETGRFARLRNSSKLIIEGDSYLYGNIDCDATSYVENLSGNIQSRQDIISNNMVNNDVVIAHYKVFPKRTNLWYETIKGSIVKPLELALDYKVQHYNGRNYITGRCKLPMGDVDMKGKTIAIRIVSPNSFTSTQRKYPVTINADMKNKTRSYSQGRSSSLEGMSIFYAPHEENLGLVERGERLFFLPSVHDDDKMHNIMIFGNESLLISDIYVIDKDSKEITGNEKLRIIDVLNTLDSYMQEDGYLIGYNKGASSERPSDLKREDEGFEYFDTTLHKLVFWTGDISVGDKGWVDAMGNYPNRK